MGVFDCVRCDAPLPDGKPTPSDLFQTTDFDCPYLEHYTITAEGRLIKRVVRYDTDPIDAFVGDKDMRWHGYLNFGHFDTETRESRDFRAKFTDGQLVEIVDLERECADG